MPQGRGFTNLSVNIPSRRELSPTTKSRIHGRSLAGQSSLRIEKHKTVPRSTIDHLLKRAEQQKTTANAPRTGRPRTYDARDERRVVCTVRLHPKFTYEDLRRITSLNFENETLRTILRDHHILNWRSKKRPALTEEHARIRSAFARAWLDFDWLTVLFLDECSVEKGVGKELSLIHI